MTSKILASFHRQTKAAANAPMHGRETRRAGVSACLILLIDLLVPFLLLAGCATGFGSSQGERESVVIGYGTSGPRTLLLRPVASARVSSPFGERPSPLGGGGSRMHRGIDLAAPMGTPVRAAGDGVVISVGPRGDYGHYVRIHHDDTYQTAYAHLSRYADRLERGARVRQGEVIGYVGSTGRSTGPHLHYEVLVDGLQLDPFELRPSFAGSIKAGAAGSLSAVGRAFWSAGKAVTRTAKGALLDPVSGMLADLTGED